MARQGPIFHGRTGLGRASRTLAFAVGLEYGPHPFPWPSRTPRAGHAPVAQLDRASDYGSEGWEFESLRARQCFQYLTWISGRYAGLFFVPGNNWGNSARILPPAPERARSGSGRARAGPGGGTGCRWRVPGPHLFEFSNRSQGHTHRGTRGGGGFWRGTPLVAVFAHTDAPDCKWSAIAQGADIGPRYVCFEV